MRDRNLELVIYLLIIFAKCCFLSIFENVKLSQVIEWNTFFSSLEVWKQTEYLWLATKTPKKFSPALS